MKVIFSVDAKAAIRGGHSKAGEVSLELDPASLPQEDRDLIAARYSGSSCKIEHARDVGGRIFGEPAKAPTIAALLDSIREGNAAAAKFDAERLEVENTELTVQESLHAEIFRERRTKGRIGHGSRIEPESTYHGLIYAAKRAGELKTFNSPEWKAWVAELDAQSAVGLAELRAAEEAEKEAKAKIKSDGIAVLRQWAEANGSELTKARIAEGFDCWVSSASDNYLGARGLEIHLTSEFELIGTDDQPTVDTNEPRKCPTLAEIESLRKIRPLLREGETAELRRIKYEVETDSDGIPDEDAEPLIRTEICVSVPVPGCGIEDLYFLIAE